MKVGLHFLFFNLFMSLMLAPASQGRTDCSKCDEEVQGMPAPAIVLALAKNINEIASNNERSQYIQKYCMRFQKISWENVGTTIKEMDNDPLPIDDYFKHSQCQMELYSESVTSPMIHYIAENPSNREKILSQFDKYYRKKRQDISIFTAALNMKNSKGETFLDYVETLTVNKTYTPDMIDGPIKNIIAIACAADGKYFKNSNKHCPGK